VIPKGSVSLRAARQDCDYNASGSLFAPALADRTEGGAYDVSLKELGGTVIGMNQLAGGWDTVPHYAYHNRTTCWPETSIWSAYVLNKTFRPGPNSSYASCARADANADAVISIMYHGYAPSGNYVLTGHVARNFAANMGAPGQVALFGCRDGWWNGTPLTYYGGPDWASAWGELPISEPIAVGSYNYLTLVAFHKVLGYETHEYTAPPNQVFGNNFTNLRLRSA
jgi:hypothetical protein